MLTKTCSACQSDLPLDRYSPHPTGRHGRHPRCKACRSAEEMARYADSESRRARFARRAGRVCAYSECQESIADRQASATHCSYTCARLEKRAHDIATRKLNACEWCGCEIPASRRRSAKFCTTTCRGNAQSTRRRARKRGHPQEPYSRQEVWIRDRGECRICGLAVDPNDWHLDHIIPISCDACRGSDTFANVAVTHPSCNLSKGDKCPHCSAMPALGSGPT